MEGAVNQLGLDVHNRVAGQDAALQRLFNAGLSRADELARDRATDDAVFEDEAGARLERFDVKDDVAELAAAAGLADKASFNLVDRPGDGCLLYTSRCV